MVLNGSQIGIYSYGYIDCESGHPVVYTDIPYYRKWIKDEMDSYELNNESKKNNFFGKEGSGDDNKEVDGNDV